MGKWRGKENPTWQGGRSKWNPTCIIVPDDKEIDRIKVPYMTPKLTEFRHNFVK